MLGAKSFKRGKDRGSVEKERTNTTLVYRLNVYNARYKTVHISYIF